MPMTTFTPTVPPCRACQDTKPLSFEFSMAFQPIVDVTTREIFAYEALVRGHAGAALQRC